MILKILNRLASLIKKLLLYGIKIVETVYNAIVWQCRRTKDYCDSFSKVPNYFEKTGLYIDSYFSASKINWILNHNKSNKNQDEKIFYLEQLIHGSFGI